MEAYSELTSRLKIIVTVAAALAVTAPTISTAGLILHHSYDTDLTDSSGNGINGSAAGTGGTIVSDAIFGTGSFSTAGTGYVSYATQTFDTSSDWSISFWYKSSEAQAGTALAGHSGRNDSFVYNRDGGVVDTDDRNYYLRTGHSSDTNTWASSALSDPEVDTGVWHHIALTSDGSANTILAYEDGVLMTSNAWDTADDTAMRLSTLGGGLHATPAPGGIFKGQLDELWIFDHTLTASDVGVLFSTNTNPVPEPGTYALMSIGLAAFGWFVRRRRTAKTVD